MEIKGYIRLSRKFFENSLWTEPRVYSRAEAWLDLIQMARFESTTEFLTNRAIEVGRGEIPASRRYLETRWQWSNTKVDNFLKALQKRQQISQRNANGQSIITLCNYDIYNPVYSTKNAKEESSKTPTERQQNANGTPNIKNLKKENNLKEIFSKENTKKADAVASSLSFDEIFNVFRKQYPGTKRGNETEFLNFQKKHKDWEEVIPVLIEKIDEQKAWRKEAEDAGMFIPAWKNLQTWINQRCWEEELEIITKKNGLTKQSSNDRLHFGGNKKNYVTEPTVKFDD